MLAAFLRADALLAPAMREAAGWAVAEALASGCPVVCVDRGGPLGHGRRRRTAPSCRGEATWSADWPRASASVTGRINPVNRWAPDRLPAILATWYNTTRVPH